MTTPSLLFGALIALICGLIFHIFRGGSFSRLLLHVFTAEISFFVGHFVGQWINWHLWRFGALNLFPALLATTVGLVATAILSGPEKLATKK